MLNDCIWICIEGCDGTGKTTQVLELKKKLHERGINVYSAHVFDTTIGKELRNIFMNNELTNLEEVLLLFWARIEYIKKMLEISRDFDVIVTDRWLLSIRSMQGLEEQDIPMIELLEERINKIGKPDITFILDVHEKICRERMQRRNESCDRIEAKGVAFHGRVRQSFLKSGLSETDTYILDGNKSISAISNDIFSLCMNKIRALKEYK